MATPAFLQTGSQLVPGLPVLSGAVLDAARASGLLDRLRSFVFLTAEMAPAFPAGCIVAAEPITAPDQVQTGWVYAVTVDERPRYVGRLAGVETDGLYALQLSYDDGSTPPAPVILRWDDPRVQLWRVTHYLTQPAC